MSRKRTSDRSANTGAKPLHVAVKEYSLRFAKLIENSYDGISLLDKNLDVIYRSRSAERINGWPDGDRDKQEIRALTHPNDRARLNIFLAGILKAPGEPRTIEFRSKHFDGHFIWLQCTFTNYLEDADIAAIVCNFKDVTDEKEASNLLQNTISELYAYKHALDEGAILAITDQKGIITYANDNFCRISKYDREELIGRDHRVINSGYHPKSFIKELWATIAGGRVWKGELKNRAKDGSYYWVDTTIVPFLNEKRKPYQYVAIRSDITARKLSEEKVAENALFIKTVTDSLPVLIAYWSSDLRCRFANKTYLEWFEKTPAEMIGIRKTALMGGREYQECASHIHDALLGNSQSFERTFVKNNGQKIDTHTQYIPDIDGETVRGFYSIIYDLTDIKQAEQEIKRKNEQIEDILNHITDGFIALDNERRYTYVNRHIGAMTGKSPQDLIGRKVWDIFPDAVGSATYRAIEAAFTERKFIRNEDHYAPLDLWQENRIYPTSSGVSMFIRDITNQKHEEQHLRLLESVIINTTEAVLITEAEPLDEPGPRIVYVNQAFADMTGYTIGELEGKTPRVLQGPKSDLAELKKLSQAMHAGQSYELTTVNYKKSGEEFWINFAVSPVSDAHGKITHFIAIERDVTASKNEELQKNVLAEISLVFNEEGSLKDILQIMLERLVVFGGYNLAEAWVIGADREHIGLLAKYNPTERLNRFYAKAGDIKNLRKGEGLAGVAWESKRSHLWTDVGKNKLFKRHKAAFETGIKSILGLPLMHNNSVVGVLLLGLNDDAGENAVPRRLSEAVGKHIGAEIKRKQLEEELNQVFSFAPDIICVAGTDGYFKKVNPAMLDILEYSEEQLLSRPFNDFIYPDDRISTTDELNMIAGQQPSVYFENRYITRTGSIKWLAWTSTPASDEGLIFAVAKDITDRKVSEIKLRELNDNLQKHARELAVSNAELEQFAYVASHDLQEPLRMVTSFLTQLEKKYSDVVDDKGKRYIYFAVDGAKRMRQIILDLLEFSRVGRTEDDMEEVDLNKLVNEIYVLHHRQIEELKAVVAYENLPKLISYKTPLRQVFQNLISNSLKYHAPGRHPQIGITAKETESMIEVAISDNGIGIAPQYYEKIFIIFQRLHTKEQYPGTGMGLAITKKIIENLGGKIWVESKERIGTTFHFTLLKKH